MTPQELGRALAEEMRKQAIVDRDIAKTHARNAMDFQQQADNSRRLTEHFKAMADGWEQTADKLASGAITLGDAETLAAVRGGLADAQEAIDPRLPFAKQREQLAAANAAPKPAARGFNVDDVVNVSDPESPDFGKRATVVSTWSNGSITLMFGNGHTWSFRPSQLMHHAEFVAQMDAAEQQAAKDAEAADDVYSAEERADDDAWAEAAADYAASLEPGIEAEL